MFPVDLIAPQLSTVATGPRKANIPALREKRKNFAKDSPTYQEDSKDYRLGTPV